jgi:RNA recognition motif-containing protein
LTGPSGVCRDVGMSPFPSKSDAPRIVEYSTREEAQNAVQALSNQTLMGRQVFVREVLLPGDNNLTCRTVNKSTGLVAEEAIVADTMQATVAIHAEVMLVVEAEVETSKTPPVDKSSLATSAPVEKITEGSLRTPLVGKISKIYSDK